MIPKCQYQPISTYDAVEETITVVKEDEPSFIENVSLFLAETVTKISNLADKIFEGISEMYERVKLWLIPKSCHEYSNNEIIVQEVVGNRDESIEYI